MTACITGMGIKAPQISDLLDFKNVLEKGIKVIKFNDLGNGKKYLSGIIEDSLIDIDPALKRVPRPLKILISAAREALEMANIHQVSGAKVGIIVGSSGGLIQEVERNSEIVRSGKRLSPFSIGNMNNNSLSTGLNAFLKLNATLQLTISNSCTSGTDALILGKILIETEQLDICIVAGVDSVFTDVVIESFNRLHLLAREEAGDLASGMPFSKGNRFALSEGAGVIVLEKEHFAKIRNAEILGYLKKGSMNNDGISIHKSEKNGKNMLKAVQDCMDGERPTYINSQALGLEENDRIEEYVVSKGLGSEVRVTSIKGMVGHFMGATGTIQTIASVLSIRDSFIPPTLMVTEVDKQIKIVTETVYEPINTVLITSHGYGGNNSCLLVSGK